MIKKEEHFKERSGKYIKRALKDNEKNLADVLASIPDLMLVLDKDGRYIDIFPDREDMLYKSFDELLGRTIHEVLEREDAEKIQEVINNVLETNKLQEFDYLLNIRGEPRRFSARIAKIDIDHKECVLWVARDITLRKTTEEILKESEEKFRTFFIKAGAGMAINSPNGNFLEVNNAFCHFLGYSGKELLNMKVMDITHPEDQALTSKKFDAIRKKEIEKIDIEKRYTRKDGQTVWGHTTATWIFDHDGNPLYAIALIQDITKQKNAEKERMLLFSRTKKQHETIVKIATHKAVNDGNVNDAMRVITKSAAEALEVARVSIWFLNEDNNELKCVNLYETTQEKHSEGMILWAQDSPNYFEALKSGRVVDAHDARNDPRTKEFTDNYLIPLGITSMLDAAIRVSGNIVGIVCHEHIGDPRTWSADEMAFAGAIADHMAQVLLNNERKLVIEKLHNAHDELEQRVKERTAELLKENSERKMAELALLSSKEELKKQKQELEHKNLALKEVLAQIEIEKKKIQDDITSNIDQFLHPTLKKLERKGSPLDREYIQILERNLSEITSRFGNEISRKHLKLTPREIEICNMIKNGLSSKEISVLLHISFRTIEIHRTNIRRKLSIANKNINLATYLQSL